MSGNVSVTVGSGGSVSATIGQRVVTTPPDVTRLDDTTASAVSDEPIDVQNYIGTPTWDQLVAAHGRG